MNKNTVQHKGLPCPKTVGIIPPHKTYPCWFVACRFKEGHKGNCEPMKELIK